MLGTSIGPVGNSSASGTLGFYLKIEHQGKTEIFTVTCHHVVAPGMYITPFHMILLAFINQLETLGIEAAVDTQKSPLQVESPSKGDHDTWVAELVRILSSSARINGFFAGMNLGMPVDRSYEAQLQTALAFSRQIGPVRYVTSGLTEKSRLYHDCRLDWALVECTAPRFSSGLDGLSNVSTL